MKMNCCWYCVERLCALGARHLACLALFLALPAVMRPQVMPQDLTPDRAAEARGLPSGFRVNSISGWVSRDYLLVSNTAGAPLDKYVLGYGGGADAGLYLPGKTSRASIDYSLGYNGNTTYSQLNGFDHRLSLSWTSRLSRSVSLSLTGAGESVTVQGLLFQQAAGTAPDLSNASTLAGSLTPAGTAGATNSILYPARRQTASITTTLSYTASPRVSWYLNLHGTRLLPSHSSESNAQSALSYAGETDGGASLSMSYALSRRTAFGAEVGYYRLSSILTRTQVGSAGLSLTRVLSRRWFGWALAGYGLGDYFTVSSRTSVRRPDFTGRATLGTTLDGHTFTLSAGQRIGDSYGFGAQRTLEGNLAWIWHPRRQNWSFQASGAYERLTGNQVNKIQSAVLRAALTRRLTARLSCTLDGGYAWGIGQTTTIDWGRQTQNGARFSLVWRPAGTLW